MSTGKTLLCIVRFVFVSFTVRLQWWFGGSNFCQRSFFFGLLVALDLQGGWVRLVDWVARNGAQAVRCKLYIVDGKWGLEKPSVVLGLNSLVHWIGGKTQVPSGVWQPIKHFLQETALRGTDASSSRLPSGAQATEVQLFVSEWNPLILWCMVMGIVEKLNQQKLPHHFGLTDINWCIILGTKARSFVVLPGYQEPKSILLGESQWRGGTR